MSAAHILTYAKHLGGGGVERAMLRLAGGWLAAGRRVTLVVGRLAGPLVAELPAGLEIVPLAAPTTMRYHRSGAACCRCARCPASCAIAAPT